MTQPEALNRPYKADVAGSTPVSPTNDIAVLKDALNHIATVDWL